MTNPIYHEPERVTRKQAERALAGDDPSVVNPTLFALVFGDEDPQWVEEQCLRLSVHPVWNIRAAAATALGHLAVFHRSLDLTRVVPVMTRLLGDEPNVAPSARNAWDEIVHAMPEAEQLRR
jgi:hypothetical protein